MIAISSLVVSKPNEEEQAEYLSNGEKITIVRGF